MLFLYKRHTRQCGHRSRTYRKCKCPIWVQGIVDDIPVRKSLGLISWDRADEKRRELEEGEHIQIEAATRNFIVIGP